MTNPAANATRIEASLDENISKLCPFTFGDKYALNHCAHYVSHMLDYSYGVTCKGMSVNTEDSEEDGATLRVNELFNRSQQKGYLQGRNPPLAECLIYVTVSANVAGRGNRLRMSSMSKKHVGIWHKNRVWNYANGTDKVVANTLQDFRSKFDVVYKTRRWRVVYLYGNLL